MKPFVKPYFRPFPQLAWLQSFVAVAELRSYVKAGRMLGVHQTTVIRHVDHLEDWLHTPLFDGCVPPALSPFGERYAVFAGQVLRLVTESQELIPDEIPPHVKPSGRDIEIF